MEPKSELRFDVQLKSKDYLDLWKTSPVRHALWILYLLAAFYAYWAFAVFMNEGFTTDTGSTIVSFCGVSIFALAGAYSVPRIRNRMSFSGPLSKEPKEMLVDDHGLHSSSALCDVHYRWGAFTSIHETKASFVFHTHPLVGLLVPKRCLTNDQTSTALRELIAANFPGKKRLNE